MSAGPMSFERQVALFLGGMADEVALGPRTPPRPMLRRARQHMATSIAAAALIVVVVAVLAIASMRGLHHAVDQNRIVTKAVFATRRLRNRAFSPPRWSSASWPGQ